MKVKNIVVGLSLLFLFFPKQAVIAHISKDEALEKSAGELYELIMCPICSGQTIAQSTSGTSIQMRDLVLKKLRQGETKEEILQYFVSRYGERIMAKPIKKGFNLMLWFFPFVLVVLVAIVISLMIRRWTKRISVETVSDLDEGQLSEYKERLEKELKEFGQGF